MFHIPNLQALLAAKIAALKDEKAKTLVDTASLAYNVAMGIYIRIIFQPAALSSKWRVSEDIAHRKNTIWRLNVNIILKNVRWS